MNANTYVDLKTFISMTSHTFTHSFIDLFLSCFSLLKSFFVHRLIFLNVLSYFFLFDIFWKWKLAKVFGAKTGSIDLDKSYSDSFKPAGKERRDFGPIGASPNDRQTNNAASSRIFYWKDSHSYFLMYFFHYLSKDSTLFCNRWRC